MWTSTALLACLVALVAAHSLPDESDRYFQASKEYVQRQKLILQLLQRPHGPEDFSDLPEALKNYRIEEHVDKYEDSAHVKNFVKYQKAGLLFPRDQIYNQFSEHGIKDYIYMFDLLLFSKDLDIFFMTSAYLKKYGNFDIFYFAFITALEVREDTRDFYFPPSYVVNPHLFFDERVLQQAEDGFIKGFKSGKHEKVIMYFNRTDFYDASYDQEASMYYFTEDPALNTFNVEFNRRFPAFYGSHKYPEFHDRKGELLLHYLRQLLARFYLERLSNNLGDMPYITKDLPLPGYFPRLRFVDGQRVTPRQPFTQVRDTKEILVKDFEYYSTNLRRAIDAGYMYDVNGTKLPLDYPHGLDLLGEAAYFYGEDLNSNYYGPYLNKILHHLGHIADPEEKYNLPPSALMRPETALRDPLFYFAINKFFQNFYYRYLEKAHKHTKEDVLVPEIKIENVDVSKLTTVFESHDFDLTNVFYRTYEKEQEIETYARTIRLNHRPFSYKAFIESEKDMDVIVKAYLMPKYDIYGRLIPFNERIFYAFEIDRTVLKVTTGKSTIERKSEDFTVAVNDPPTFSEMRQKIEAALEDKEPLKVDKYARPYGFPQHLLLPKGTESGLPVEFVVAIYPYQEADTTDRRAYHLPSFPLLGASYNVKFPDPRPIDFPADKLYRSEYDFQVPNIFGKEVRIYHKKLEDVNAVPDAHH